MRSILHNNVLRKAMTVVTAAALMFGATGVTVPEETVQAEETKQAFEDGTYKVPGALYKTDQKTKSMADSALDPVVKMDIKEGKVSLTLTFHGMTMGTIKGYLGSLRSFETGYQKNASGNPEGTLKDVTVLQMQTYTDGSLVSDDYGTNYPAVVNFTPNAEAMTEGFVPLRITVPVMNSITPGAGTQNVYLKLELSQAVKTAEADPDFVNPANREEKTPAPTPENAKTPAETQAGTTPETVKDTVKKVTSKGVTYQVLKDNKAALVQVDKKVKKLTIPANVKIQGKNYKVTEIGKQAAKNCKKLMQVTIGKNITKIGKRAFRGCSKLKTIRLAKDISKKNQRSLKKQLKQAGAKKAKING